MDAYGISILVFGIIFFIALLIYTYKFKFWRYARRPMTLLPDAEQNKKYAVLVPARDESRVIRGLLDSIKDQKDFNLDNLETFVIVADKSDPTIKICKEYARTTAYTLPCKVKSKGETLKVFLNHLKEQNKHYDGYFIIDADNVLMPDFIRHMHNAMSAGKDVVLGGRLSKKPSGSWVSAGSTLTWTYLNTMNNKCRSENGKNILVQGSPLLINKTIIEDFFHFDWPLTTLTEDLELGYMCMVNNFQSFYYEYALAYDEQPETRAAGFAQRMRWVRGHHQTNRLYRLKVLKTKCKYNDGIYKFDTLYSLAAPLIMLIDCFLFGFYSLILTIVANIQGHDLWYWTLLGGLSLVLGGYLLMVWWTWFAIHMDREKLRLTKRQIIQACFTVPLFYFEYIPVYVKTLFAKDIQWVKIEHKQSIEK